MDKPTKRLTLSFDNGPTPEVTPAVLDQLAKYNIKSTFFVCGKEIIGEPQRSILKRTKQEGHVLGNHTYNHSLELGLNNDPDAPLQEIGRTQELLGELAEEHFFRPYGGDGTINQRLLSSSALAYLIDGQYSCVLWNSVPRDWERIVRWPEHALQDIKKHDWTLMVLHDTDTGAMKQLARFLEMLQQQEVEIVQSFPSDCVPIYRGKVVGKIDHIVSL